jgi:hypothetical protein
MDWIQLTQDMYQLRISANTEWTFRPHKRWGRCEISWLAERLLASQGQCCTESPHILNSVCSLTFLLTIADRWCVVKELKLQYSVGRFQFHVHGVPPAIRSLPNNKLRLLELRHLRNNATLSAYIIEVSVVLGRDLFGDNVITKYHTNHLGDKSCLSLASYITFHTSVHRSC